MGLYCRLYTIISEDALLSLDLGWLLPHWRRQPGLTWRDGPYFSTGMAVLRRVTRELPWLRRADGVVIRTGSVCEQQRRQSQPLTCFGGCSLNRWQEGSETQPKGGPFSVHTSARRHLWGQPGFLKKPADDWVQIHVTQSRVSLCSLKWPGAQRFPGLYPPHAGIKDL